MPVNGTNSVLRIARSFFRDRCTAEGQIVEAVRIVVSGPRHAAEQPQPEVRIVEGPGVMPQDATEDSSPAEAVKKRDWLRANTAKTRGIWFFARCLSHLSHSRSGQIIPSFSFKPLDLAVRRVKI